MAENNLGYREAEYNEAVALAKVFALGYILIILGIALFFVALNSNADNVMFYASVSFITSSTLFRLCPQKSNLGIFNDFAAHVGLSLGIIAISIYLEPKIHFFQWLFS